MVGLPPFRFPDLATPHVYGTRAFVNERFSPRHPGGPKLDEFGLYSGNEDEWRSFKSKLSSRTIGARQRAVAGAAISTLEAEAPARELPPLLARRRRERQKRPWREESLRHELRYNQIEESAATSLHASAFRQAQQPQQEHSHAQYSAASHYPMPAYPDALPPDEAYEVLRRDVAASCLRHVPGPIWLHGKAYPMDGPELTACGAHRGGSYSVQSAPSDETMKDLMRLARR